MYKKFIKQYLKKNNTKYLTRVFLTNCNELLFTLFPMITHICIRFVANGCMGVGQFLGDDFSQTWKLGVGGRDFSKVALP